MTINTDHTVNKKQISKQESVKTQILLAHTSSTIEEYFTKIHKRHYGAYDSIFTYTIGQDGTVYQHYNPNYYSKIFNLVEVDRQIISVALENAGWLKQKTSAEYIDWKGHIYKGQAFEKTWRGKNFWAEYTPEQVESLLNLIPMLIKEFEIEPNFSGKNLPIDDPKNFKGVLNRSNYAKFYYDLSPAFNFDLITQICTNKNKIKLQ